MYDVKACYEHLNLSAGHLSYEPFCYGFTICTDCTKLFTDAAGDLVCPLDEVASRIDRLPLLPAIYYASE